MNKHEKEIEQWMPLIKKLSQKFSNKIAGFDDLVNEGIVALIDGLNSFTIDKAPIEGYLKNVILKGIYNAAISNSFAVHVPSGSMRIINNNPETIKNLKGINIGYIDADNEELIDICDTMSIEDNKDSMIDIRSIVNTHDRDEIAHLYFFDGLNYEEIAKKAGFSLATISRHINHIRELITEKCV